MTELTCYFRPLLSFANILNPDQDLQNVGPDLIPNCLTLMVFLISVFFCLEKGYLKNISMQQILHGFNVTLLYLLIIIFIVATVLRWSHEKRSIQNVNAMVGLLQCAPFSGLKG